MDNATAIRSQNKRGLNEDMTAGVIRNTKKEIPRKEEKVY
jgi:hypothetical protein